VIFYKSRKAFNSGLLTGISNRVGDALILVSLPAFSSCSHLCIPAAQTTPNTLRLPLIIIIVVAACTKSAQLPFSAWLPAAIAAPTPVSALVHSSTLVTAGVYLILRIINWLPLRVLTTLSVVGAATMLIARFSALMETDGKKLVALSTLSQLGVMICSAGLNAAAVVIFHLLVHAFFKALLFIATGVLIHNSSGRQDLRVMGGAFSLLPVARAAVMFTKLRLMGIPFFAAFYSKEMVLERLRSSGSTAGVSYVLIVAGVGLTVAYSGRFISTGVLGATRNQPAVNLREGSTFLLARIAGLTLPRVLSGKYLFFFLSDLLNTPVLALGRKVVVLTLLGFALIFPALRGASGLRSQLKYLGGIWGLAAAVGTRFLQCSKRAGVHLARVFRFSIVDYLIMSWAARPARSLGVRLITNAAPFTLSALRLGTVLLFVVL